MILMASERIAAPRDFVFARAGEFDRFARAAQQRGAVVARAEGSTDRPRYEVQYPFRDALWPAALELRGASAPEAMEVAVEATVVEALAQVAFQAPEPDWTLVEMTVTLRPRNMQGRLLLGSLHVLRGRVQQRLEGDLAALARGAEALWREAGAG